MSAPHDAPHDAKDNTPLWAGDLFGETHLAPAPAAPPAKWRKLMPGIAISAIVSAAGAWFSDHYGMPIILMGLILGLAMQFVSADPRTAPGLEFVGRTCLRWGIVLLGFQVTLSEIGALGLGPFAALLVVMSAAIVAALLGARLAGQGLAIGILAGGATAICGASAALALYGVVGRERVSQAQFTLTLVVVSVASALAMTIYPELARLAHFDARQAGFLTGAAIHDVAQSIGGGYAVSNAAGAAATVVKLTRVALLGPLVALAAIAVQRFDPRGERVSPWKALALPPFILAFLALVVGHSLIAVPPLISANALLFSKGLLLLAVTATAMRTRTDLILQLGWTSVLPVLAATATSFVVAFGFALWVIH
ncbi:YeiH family protein [Novosphingobium sp. KACC 22771]|uniref:YeiH family protein n=1 Tax=Novosphingobium sp. KACC 22771 TaxID=3025670 RepID=UPI0023670381|nr:putative sulfate exporter family transporter [Novosphingobium sp. KACC 22771]WDF75172.1 putative sulfate exporter family transporter [Novosphingobium sp. KACC 22771]